MLYKKPEKKKRDFSHSDVVRNCPNPPGSVAQNIFTGFENTIWWRSCRKKIYYDKEKTGVVVTSWLVSCWGDQKTCLTVSTKQLTEVRGYFQHAGGFPDVVILFSCRFFRQLPLGSAIAQITDLRCGWSFVYYSRALKRGNCLQHRLYASLQTSW